MSAPNATCIKIGEVLIQLAKETQAELDSAAARKKNTKEPIKEPKEKKETCVFDETCDPACKLVIDKSPIVMRRRRRIDEGTDKKIIATFIMKEAMKLSRLFTLRDQINAAIKRQSRLIIDTVGLEKLLDANRRIIDGKLDEDPDEDQLPDLRLID